MKINFYTSGWKPLLAWTCLFIIIFRFIIIPIWNIHLLVTHGIDTNILRSNSDGIVTILLALIPCATHSLDSIKGILKSKFHINEDEEE